MIHKHDARDMRHKVESNSIALVVTSPPYFAGKEYEESLGDDGVPGTYFEYLELLERRVRGVQARSGAGRSHRRERREPRASSVPLAVGRRNRHPAGPRPAAPRRGDLVEGPGGRRHVPGAHSEARQPGSARRHRAVVIASKGGSTAPSCSDRAPRARGLPSTATISRTSSSKRRPTCGRSPPRARPESVIPAPFPVELPEAAHRALHL